MNPRLLLLLVYAWHLAVGATLWLGDVEGYYWLWSRELEGSYLDHPPLDAWLLAGSTALFGNTRFAVRFVPATLSLCSAWMMCRTAERLWGEEAGRRTVLVLYMIPGFIVLGIAASPDAPVVTAGAAILWVCARAFERPSPRWLPLLGALVGVGVLAKLTMLHFALGVLWVWVSEPRFRSQLRAWNVAASLALFFASVAPVLVWNAEHDFAMWRFHAARVGWPTWENAAKLVFGQLGYYSPFIVFAAGARLTRRSWLSKLAWPSIALLAPTILCTRDAEPQWTALAYLPALLLLARDAHRAERAIQRSWPLIAVALVFAHLHLLTPVFVRLVPEPLYRPRVDLANDLEGWPEVALAAQELAATLSPPVVLAASHYTLCGQLGFATADTPKIVCPTPRVDAFDYIPSRAAPPRHANVVFLADDRFSEPPEVFMRFERCVKARHLEIARGELSKGGKIVRRFDLYTCDNYLGEAKDVSAGHPP